MDKNYGLLINNDTKLLRSRFVEMTKLLGILTKYEFPLTKQTTLQGEYNCRYSEPIEVGCIFEEHLNQKTARKLGWDAELTENAAVIHVPYDLENLQIGCLFTIPSAFGDSRKFRVTEMSSIMVYPASISCKLVPEYESELPNAAVEKFDNTNFNMLREGN